jgi:hypothetical protein
MLTPPGHAERERVLRRLASPEGDDELRDALDRMRKNFYPFWLALDELRLSEDPDGFLRGRREAPKGSQGWRKARFREEALEVLRAALSSR